MKYSHATNCTAKVSPGPKEASVLPAVEEEEEEEEPATEEEEEVKPSPAPVLKRTVSVKPKQFPPVKKTVNKVKQPQPQQPQQPTPTNIYGRENRNERAKQKTEEMCNLFVNAF